MIVISFPGMGVAIGDPRQYEMSPELLNTGRVPGGQFPPAGKMIHPAGATVKPAGHWGTQVPKAGPIPGSDPAAQIGFCTFPQEATIPAGAGRPPHVALVILTVEPLVMFASVAVTSKHPVVGKGLFAGPVSRFTVLPHRNVNVWLVPSGLKASAGEALTAHSVGKGTGVGVAVAMGVMVGVTVTGVGDAVAVGEAVGVRVGVGVGDEVGVGVAVAMALPGRQPATLGAACLVAANPLDPVSFNDTRGCTGRGRAGAAVAGLRGGITQIKPMRSRSPAVMALRVPSDGRGRRSTALRYSRRRARASGPRVL